MLDCKNCSDHHTSEVLALGEIPENVYNLSLTVLVSLGLFVNIFGVTGNVLIIIVYSRMGFSDSTNISLVALAIADLGSILPSIYGCFMVLAAIYEQLPLSMQILRLVSSWPHIALTRVTACITCFISLERCLCVMMPLKVKSIITARRTVYILVLIYLIIIPPVSMMYFKWSVGWKFFAARNETLIGLVVSRDDTLINSVIKSGGTYYCTFLPLATGTFVTVCTIYLTVSLRRSKRWRDTITASSVPDASKTEKGKSGAPATVSKEERTVKIVIAVAITFVVSMLPLIGTNITKHIEAEYSSLGRYSMVYNVVGAVSDLLENINASINLIIYYKMSSKFREHLLIFLNKGKN
ncbi:alpha-1A adrenergic receptor [Elysia marginata]|uniref:Alpha-1A adrenergic receptor n=1 Tax=Elysia marginata TaxID=1093978 RepID=A0AAV4FG21_9GAST|nr:alpha-1A adrenergic receptor [Elysia marginata]